MSILAAFKVVAWITGRSTDPFRHCRFRDGCACAEVGVCIAFAAALTGTEVTS